MEMTSHKSSEVKMFRIVPFVYGLLFSLSSLSYWYFDVYIGGYKIELEYGNFLNWSIVSFSAFVFLTNYFFVLSRHKEINFKLMDLIFLSISIALSISIVFSPDKDSAFLSFYCALSVVLFYFGIASLEKDDLHFSVQVFTVFSILFLIAWNITYYQLNAYPFGNQGFLSQYQLFLIPLLAYAFRDKKKILALLLIPLLIMVAISYGYDKWIAISILSFLYILRGKGNKSYLYAVLLLVIFVSAVTFAFKVGYGHTVESIMHRLQIWVVSFTAWTSSPLLGYGLRGFEQAYAQSAADALLNYPALLPPIDPFYSPGEVHNEPLELMMHSGVFGLIVSLFTIYSIMRLWFIADKRDPLFFCYTLLVLVLVISCVSFPLQNPPTLIEVCIACAIVRSSTPTLYSLQSSHTRERVIAALLLIPLGFAMNSSIHAAKADIYRLSADKLAELGQFPLSREAAAIAWSIDHRSPAVRRTYLYQSVTGVNSVSTTLPSLKEVIEKNFISFGENPEVVFLSLLAASKDKELQSDAQFVSSLVSKIKSDEAYSCYTPLAAILTTSNRNSVPSLLRDAENRPSCGSLGKKLIADLQRTR